MNRRMRMFVPLLALLAMVFALIGCGGGGGSSSSAAPGGNGTLRVSLTDAPSCGYEQVNVTIEKIRVHRSSSAADGDTGWGEIVLSPARRIDLLTLTNGVFTELGQTPLAAGRYTQLRLVLAENGSNNPLANSVLPSGATQEVGLDAPSALQSGLKLNVAIDVEASRIADFVIDFDACKSVVRAGNSGNYVLKPVISVIPLYGSGVSGHVATAVANGNTVVSLQQAGVVVKATVPDAAGKFLLQPVAPGSYDLVITAPGYATTVITGVPVTAEAVIALNAATSPLVLMVAGSGTAKGALSGLAEPIDATVVAIQSLASGRSIEVAGRPVDASTGAYAYALPAAAPQVAAYVAAPASPAFVADASAGNAYMLHAQSGSTTRISGPVMMTSGATITTNFAF